VLVLDAADFGSFKEEKTFVAFVNLDFSHGFEPAALAGWLVAIAGTSSLENSDFK
jgi:hypothetical protein